MSSPARSDRYDALVVGGGPSGAAAAYWLAGILAGVLFLVSLLAHELAHAVVARRSGVRVDGITLWLLGGVARLDGEAPTPGRDLAIAGAGREAAARNGWLDEQKVTLEILTAIKRAGADIILTYFAKEMAALLKA